MNNALKSWNELAKEVGDAYIPFGFDMAEMNLKVAKLFLQMEEHVPKEQQVHRFAVGPLRGDNKISSHRIPKRIPNWIELTSSVHKAMDDLTDASVARNLALRVFGVQREEMPSQKEFLTFVKTWDSWSTPQMERFATVGGAVEGVIQAVREAGLSTNDWEDFCGAFQATRIEQMSNFLDIQSIIKDFIKRARPFFKAP